MADFIHLNTHTTYSLLQAIPSPKKLAGKAAELGFPAMGVVEIGNVFSAVDVGKAFPAAGVRPVMGAQLYVQVTETEGGWVTLLAQNEAGWKHVLQLVTDANISPANEDHKCISLAQLSQQTGDVICLTGGARFGVLSPFCSAKEQTAAEDLLTQLKGFFPNRLYIELQRHGEKIEQEKEPLFLKLAENLELPVVATNDVRFLVPDQRDAYNALVCIGEGGTVDAPDHTYFNEEYYLKSAEDMCALFADIPEAIENTVAIANRCGYWPEAVAVKEMFMPVWPTEDGGSVAELTRIQSTVGLEARMKLHVFPLHPVEEHEALRKKYTDRLEEELGIIISMGFDGYFLITSDFIKWAKEQDIPVGPGRGSGAGSLVAWALQITDLDPIRWDLYFERFLNPERVSLPDFDVDFCQERRDEVIDYVRRKYGDDYVSQIITFGTLKAKACIRDVGRVLQFPYGLVSRIAAFVPEGPTPPPIQEVIDTDERLQQLIKEEDGVQELLDVALQLEGCLRHASTHAAGVIIAERPIAQVCGLYKDARSPMPATQYQMFDAEFAGLVKFDFLGLKTLTTITYALEYARKVYTDVPDDILQISLADETTFEMLCQGQTMGVFQIESDGMTGMTKRMIPRDMEALSALVALYRPGPLGSGMVDDYIDVRHGKKETQYPHPLLEGCLRDTFGVPVYQEQIMRMARDMAGYSLGGADMLRRAMGKKKPAEMEKQGKIFREGAATHYNVSEADATRVFDLMAVFAGYGFNKAHSMAYALISYQTAFLKAHFPLGFMAGSMRMDKGNTEKLMRYKRELGRMGSALLPPCVNASGVNFTIEGQVENTSAKGGFIRHALSAIKGAGEEGMAAIVQERQKNGPYKDMWDFCARQAPHTLGKKNLEVLIKSGALDNVMATTTAGLGQGQKFSRNVLLHNVDILQGHCQQAWDAVNSNQIGLFGGGGEDEPLMIPTLHYMPPADAFTQLQEELQVIGFYLSSHPLKSFEAELSQHPEISPLHELVPMIENGKQSAKVAGMIMAKREMKTKSGKRMGFITLSDESGQEEFVLFPDAYESYQEKINGQDPLIVRLSLGKDGDRLRMAVETLQTLGEMTGMRKELSLHVSHVQDLQALQPFLNHNGGMTTCKICVQQGGKDVWVEIPHKIQCSPALLAQIQSLEGVVIH